MRAIIPALLVMISVSLAAQQSGDPAAAQREAEQKRYAHALELHDAGDYAGAIRIYRELLTTRPGDPTITYELAYSLLLSGQNEEAIRVAEAARVTKGPLAPRFFELLGNAYDQIDRSKEAIAAYKKGLKADPNVPSLHYNYAIALWGAGKSRDARRELQRAIELSPRYPSAHFALANIFAADGYRIQAALAYIGFLELERTSKRSAEAAGHLLALLGSGVEKKEGGNVNITIASDSKKDEGDFRTLEMMMSMAAASQFMTEEGKAPKSDAEKAASALSLFIAMVGEMPAEGKNFTIKTYGPLLRELATRELTEEFAHLALATLNLPGAVEWRDAHQADLDAYRKWSDSRR